MNDIKNVFLTKTITDLLSKEYNLPEIKFVFDETTLNSFEDCLDRNDSSSYIKGLNSIDYLKSILNDYKSGVDGIYICIRDSSRFFFLLQKLIGVYSNDFDRKLLDPSNIIRSIWLRMGTSDISNVEKFLERQILFIKNYKVLPEYRELFYFDNNDLLFSGDFVFKGTIGNYPDGMEDEMVKSLNVFKYMSSNVEVYPGHGPSTTVKEELENNPFLRGI